MGNNEFCWSGLVTQVGTLVLDNGGSPGRQT